MMETCWIEYTRFSVIYPASSFKIQSNFRVLFKWSATSQFTWYCCLNCPPITKGKKWCERIPKIQSWLLASCADPFTYTNDTVDFLEYCVQTRGPLDSFASKSERIIENIFMHWKSAKSQQDEFLFTIIIMKSLFFRDKAFTKTSIVKIENSFSRKTPLMIPVCPLVQAWKCVF